MKKAAFVLLWVVLAGFSLVGCNGGGEKTDDPNKVSSIPWNRPEKWEGQGPMGGMMPGSQ